MQTELEELRRIITRFEEEKTNLKSYLDDLTTGGKGLLYDLKVTVGEHSDLGEIISLLGGAVMGASSKAVTSLDKIVDIVSEKYEAYSITLETAASAYTEIRSRIAEINFQ